MLIGSSETMGTGVNVQHRLRALHHLDVPWLPSQIEQREGRIERQGNQNEEIELYAYATLGSMDATMWQNNERKARFIAAALSGDRSIRRVEDVGSQANQFAMAKAIASGDSRLIQKAGLDNEIARLQRQRAAHIDDQHDIRRRIHNARRDREHAEERLTSIREDITRRTPTRGEAFTMDVGRRTVTERKVAGGSLLSKVRMAVLERDVRDWHIGQIGGFDLTCSVRRNAMGQGCSADIVLKRTAFSQRLEVSDDLTALGLIARIEHALDHFETDLEEQTRRREDAANRLAGYEPRLGELFPLQGELNDKLARMAELEADLASTAGVTTVGHESIAPGIAA